MSERRLARKGSERARIRGGTSSGDWRGRGGASATHLEGLDRLRVILETVHVHRGVETKLAALVLAPRVHAPVARQRHREGLPARDLGARPKIFVENLHRLRVLLIRDAAVAEATAVTLPPRPHHALVSEHDGVRLSAPNLSSAHAVVRQRFDKRRHVPVLQVAVPQRADPAAAEEGVREFLLRAGATTPAPRKHFTLARHRHRMEVRRIDLRNAMVVKACHYARHIHDLLVRSNPKLPPLVRSPYVDLAVVRHSNGVISAARDLRSGEASIAEWYDI